MNDLKNLLERALDDGPVADAQIDPAADLARGRTRLRHRRTVTLAGTAAVALGLAVIPLTLNGSTGSAGPSQAGGSTRTGPLTKASGSQSPTLPSLELVTYHGKQAPGYRVASTPKGWAIQGGDPFVLTIAPTNTKDKHYTSFVGKLVVMLQSRDAKPPTEGTVQLVDGRPGRLTVEEPAATDARKLAAGGKSGAAAQPAGGTQMLTYQDAKGRWIVIQAPTFLGWDGARLAQFAAGVEVLNNAEAGRG
jgi:hypothetical protein